MSTTINALIGIANAHNFIQNQCTVNFGGMNWMLQQIQQCIVKHPKMHWNPISMHIETQYQCYCNKQCKIDGQMKYHPSAVYCYRFSMHCQSVPMHWKNNTNLAGHLQTARLHCFFQCIDRLLQCTNNAQLNVNNALKLEKAAVYHLGFLHGFFHCIDYILQCTENRLQCIPQYQQCNEVREKRQTFSRI